MPSPTPALPARLQAAASRLLPARPPFLSVLLFSFFPTVVAIVLARSAVGQSLTPRNVSLSVMLASGNLLLSHAPQLHPFPDVDDIVADATAQHPHEVAYVVALRGSVRALAALSTLTGGAFWLCWIFFLTRNVSANDLLDVTLWLVTLAALILHFGVITTQGTLKQVEPALLWPPLVADSNEAGS